MTHIAIEFFPGSDSSKSSKKSQVIVGSVRMGYGHHRITYSALTWALELGGKPFLLATWLFLGSKIGQNL